MSKRYKYVLGYLLVVLTGFLVCSRYYYAEDYKSMKSVKAYVDGDMLIFSKDSGLYEESITVSLNKNMEIPDSARVYYTLNGDDPTADKTEYTGPIHLDKKDDITVYPLKAVVYYNEEYSETYEKTYVLCNDRKNELNVELVCITSDRDNLYNYETGIMTRGKTYYDGLKEFDGNGFVGGNYNNRGDEWIRNAHVSMFNSEGELAVEQKIGLGISGGTSSEYNVKSLKLYADYIYDNDNDKIRYNLTNSELQSASYSFVNEYNSIRLRSGSQDTEYGNIKSAVASRLVQLSGSDQCTATKRCVVYLNGKYYGIFDMQQNYSNSYLANRFNLRDPNCIEKHKGGESGVLSRGGIIDYFNRDLNDANNCQDLEQRVDMDNFLLYYAINILCNNTDWPGNNFEMWRYVGEEDDDNIYSDGRYRFLIYDTDMIFSTNLSVDFFEGSRDDIFVALMENMYRGSNSVFLNVIASSYYRDRFITCISDLLNTSFSEDSIIKIIQEENMKIAKLRKRYHDDNYVKNADFYVGQAIQAAKNRSEEIGADFEKYFGLHEKYELKLKTSKGIAVTWFNKCIFADREYNNQYYKYCDIVLQQEAYPGYTFQYWLVNGEKQYEASLIISDEMICEGRLDIQAIALIDETPQIVISDLSAKGHTDWIRISNVGSSPSNLKNYYISDDCDNLTKYQLPDIVLESGESIVVYGSKNYHSLGDYICNFSLSTGEKLFLSNEDENLFSLSIPEMSDIETYGRYDGSNVWTFFRKTDLEQ